MIALSRDGDVATAIAYDRDLDRLDELGVAYQVERANLPRNKEIESGEKQR